MPTNRNTISITLISQYDGLIVRQHEGKLKKSRLWCQAAGLDIYLIGTASGVAHDRLTNMACNAALNMNIPLISLRYVTKGKK